MEPVFDPFCNQHWISSYSMNVRHILGFDRMNPEPSDLILT